MLCLKKENNKPISDVRRAFEDCISTLGQNEKRAMTYELMVQARVDFDEPSLSILRLHQGLDMLYGNEIADIIMEQVILRMDQLAEERAER